MSFSRFSKITVLAVSTLCLAACASVVRKDAPTIAHVHIGHAITAWNDTPGKQGLLVVAELAAVTAETNSQLMLKAARNGDIIKTKRFLNQIAIALDPQQYDPEQQKNGYGVRRGTAEAMTHLTLSAGVFDASTNVQRTVTQTNVRAQDILDSADELAVYIDAGMAATDSVELEIIAEEVSLLVKAIAGGPDYPDIYGLYNLRKDIESMIAREDPPYEVVDSYFLFNLVRLPDGQWGFGSRRGRGAAGAGY
ncbi:MAG: hypothetical protein AB8B87_21205 [Granulosicoccus sp.]